MRELPFLTRRAVVGEQQTNCYLMKNEKEGSLLVVDPGDDPDLILALAKQMGGRITDILLTHGHFDHIGAADSLREETGAGITAAAAEVQLLSDPALNLSGMIGTRLSVSVDETVEDGQTITPAGITLQVMLTPGHTIGGCCYYSEKGFVFTGDAFFAGSIGRTDFPTGSYEHLLSSIKEKLLSLPDDTMVLPGHGFTTTIGRERERNPFLR